MTNGDRRGSRLSGFWACAGGAAGMVLLLVVIDPVMRQEDCSNYGGNGNASAFSDPDSQLWFLLALLVWMALIVVEQALPVTWRHRGRVEVAARGVWAFAIALVSSCCLTANFALVCH